MRFMMCQPQIEYENCEYACIEADSPCRIVVYSCVGMREVRLVPDCCDELIWAWDGSGSCCMRPDKTKRETFFSEYTMLCGIRLEPGFMFDIPADFTAGIADMLIKENTTDRAKEIILNNVRPFIRKKCGPGTWEIMARLVIDSRGRITVKELAENFGYTVRHVNNIFNDGIGCGPKNFCMFVRFQNVLCEMGKNPYGENSEFIEKLSYADQAHFQREFKSFTGMTPRQFAKKYLIKK